MSPSPRRPRALLRIKPALLFSAALCLGACAGKPADEHRYELKGKVVSVDQTQGSVTIEHEDIPGYMAAMTMEFPVRDAAGLKNMRPGNDVKAELVVTDDAYWL